MWPARKQIPCSDTAVSAPINQGAWNGLPDDVQTRARGVANLAMAGGTDGETGAARQAYWRMREKHGFADLRRLMLMDRPRTEAGTFSGGETAGTPGEMTAAYGPVETRPAAIMGNGVMGAVRSMAKPKGKDAGNPTG